MPTGRLEQESPEFGSRVTGARKGGRPRTAPNYALAARVRAVKERLDAASPDRPICLVGVWGDFATRVRMSEDTLRTRLYNDPPTPFTAADLEAICLAFGVRPDFLLLGRGPMLENDVMENGSRDRTFASVFRSHEIGVLQARTDQDEQGLESVLPPDDELLDAVDRGILDAVEDVLAAHVNDRKLVTQSIRLAVAAAFRARKSSADIPNEAFRAAIDVVDGRVICPPGDAEGLE